MMSTMLRNAPRDFIFLFVVLFIDLCCAATVSACQIPVFRYALERWPSDDYRAVVFHRSALKTELQKELNGLSAPAKDGSRPNVEVVFVNLAEGEPAADFQALWKENEHASLPWMVLEYPERGGPRRPICWAGALDTRVAQSLRESPARTEIAKRIRGGDSAVWVFVESGDAEKDRAAATTLETELKKLEKTLRLPDLEDIVNDAAYVAENTVEIRLSFSMTRVARSDASERLLIDMLLGTEDDLRDYTEPMAFPIFGRGRVLHALIGAGINGNTIRDACVYLIGGCSCQVKDENPGIDLLMTAPWETWVGRRDAELREPETDPADAIDLILASIPDGDSETDTVEGTSAQEPVAASPPDTMIPDRTPEIERVDAVTNLPQQSASQDDGQDDGMSTPTRPNRVWPMLVVVFVVVIALVVGRARLRRPR